MNLNKLSDKIVFNSLKFIKHGNLRLVNYDGKEYHFGDSKEKLCAELKINKPGLTFKIIKNGSIGLAESYMQNDFETKDLTSLIELAAKNIKIIHRFSGTFDLPIFNKVKNLFIKNNKSRSKENISKHYDFE